MKQRNFNYGQIYIALSRVTTLESLYILGSLSINAIRANPRSLHEYNRMDSERLVQNSEGYPCNLEITFLNIRSFNKHVIDDTRLTESDTICFTETQLHASVAPKRRLKKFGMIYNNNEDKFQSLAIGFRNDVSIITDTKLNGASVIEFVKPAFDRSSKLLLLYKKTQ